MPGISDTRIGAGGAVKFSSSKAVTNASSVVSGDVTATDSKVAAQLADLQARATVLEAKLTGALNAHTVMDQTISTLKERIATLEAAATSNAGK